MTGRWRNQFFYVNIGETLFFLSEIARPSKKECTSCLKSLAPGLDIWYVASAIRPLQYDHDQKLARSECQHPVPFVNIINGHFSM